MNKRWKVQITYRTEHGQADSLMQIEELEELHDLVEHGAHWDTIMKIEIVLTRPSENSAMTLEAARHGSGGLQ